MNGENAEHQGDGNEGVANSRRHTPEPEQPKWPFPQRRQRSPSSPRSGAYATFESDSGAAGTRFASCDLARPPEKLATLVRLRRIRVVFGSNLIPAQPEPDSRVPPRDTICKP